jgi:methionyl-tRNA formyltransferase
MQLVAPAVKRVAQELGREVIQPRAVRKPELAERLRALQADVALVVAYGRILPLAILQATRLGCLNVHASLLPKLRGAAPIQWAIIRGEPRTGVCLMQMDEGMDTGPVLACSEVEIGRDETAGELALRLAALGAELVRTQLARYLCGELVPQPQDDAAATLAPLLAKEHGRIDWGLPAPELHALVRGAQPWPGAYSFVQGQRIKLHRTSVLDAAGRHGEPGLVLRADRHAIDVACGFGVLAIHELQPEGKRRMTAEQFCAGARLASGVRFTNAEQSA